MKFNDSINDCLIDKFIDVDVYKAIKEHKCIIL